MKPEHTTKLAAGSKFPALVVKNLDGEDVDISVPTNGCKWKMIVVYRGRHCPLCTKYLKTLVPLMEQYSEAKVDVAVVSADSKAQLMEHLKDMPEINADSFPIYYGMTIQQMNALGLYVSHPRSEKETDHPFAEPGLFIINSEGNVHIVDISNMPFVRPDLSQVLVGVKFINARDYPIRGTYP